jgi:spartin
MKETLLFSFPGISVSTPHTPPSTGFLVLSSCPQLTDIDPTRPDVFLRLQHTPDNTTSASPIDVLIEAWRDLHKTSPHEFILSTDFGDLTIAFSDLHHTIPQSDARIDLPAEVIREMKWEDIVREFETEIDRFVSYIKNNYSLISSPFGDVGSSSSAAAHTSYDPSSYSDEKKGSGRVVLVDEENGSEVGEVGGCHVNADGIVPGRKDPVEIIFPENGENGTIMVRPADYLLDASHSAYKNSSIVQAASRASRLVVTSSFYISNALQTGAKTFNERTQPVAKPLTFQPSTHQRFQQVHILTSTAAKFSSATLGKVQTLAQNAGAKLAGTEKNPRNPGLLNKSIIAFSTVADGFEYATKAVLSSSSQAASSVVGHRYGAEAEEVAKSLTGVAKNLCLVYIDASGVSRRAVVKGVAKGMVVGRDKNGSNVVALPNQVIDGLPPGWGDGPLGGPNAGPPSRSATPSLASPPDYATVTSSYGENGRTESRSSNTAYYPASSSSEQKKPPR